MKDLPGKRLIRGHVGYQPVAPAHFLKKAGIDLNEIKLVKLDRVDRAGAAVMSTLDKGVVDAAVLLKSVRDIN